MKTALTTACRVLWHLDNRRPRQELQFEPWETVCWIIEGWNRAYLAAVAPRLAKLVVCKIALLDYSDPVIGEYAVNWARTEATYWWGAFGGVPPERKMLAVLYGDYVETDRI